MSFEFRVVRQDDKTVDIAINGRLFTLPLLADNSPKQPPIVELVYADDWVWMLFDGVCVKNGHSLAPWHVLDALGIKYTQRDLTDDEAEEYDPPGAAGSMI